MEAGRKKTILAAVAGLVLAGIVAFTLTQKPAAPQATFTTLGGEKIALASLRGKVVLVNFWATSCPGCIHEMPDLANTHRKFQARGFETIAVAMSYDPPEYVRQFSEKNHLPFTVALDQDGSAAQAFGARVTPTTVIIDKQGDRTVITSASMPPELMPMAQMAQETGARRIYVAMPSYWEWTSALRAQLDEGADRVFTESGITVYEFNSFFYEDTIN